MDSKGRIGRQENEALCAILCPNAVLEVQFDCFSCRGGKTHSQKNEGQQGIGNNM